jgi:hypothetical protein
MEAVWLRPSRLCGVVFNAADKKIVNQPYYQQFSITMVGQADDWRIIQTLTNPWGPANLISKRIRSVYC